MADHNIYLKLERSVLMWSPDGTSNWINVTPSSPSTGVNNGDTVSWIADSSIDKIMISPKQGKILKNIDGDDTKNPKGTANPNIGSPTTEKYTISVKAVNSKGGYLDTDPEIRYPPE